MRRSATLAAAGIVVGAAMVLSSAPASAWHMQPSVELVCNGSNVRFVVRVTNTETAPAQAMTVSATDLESGVSVSLGSVLPGHHATANLDTPLTTVKAGAIRFTETWTNGAPGTDQRRVEHHAFGCDPPPAVPDGMNGLTLIALGAVAVPVAFTWRRRRQRAGPG